MNERLDALTNQIDLMKVVGYLNFSNGRPDPRFQISWNQGHTAASAVHPDFPWRGFTQWLLDQLPTLKSHGGSAFSDLSQAESVLTLLDRELVPAYLSFHGDLLAHVQPRELGQPFFIVRALEAILSQGGPWSETQRILNGAIDQLNDFLGYRPVPTLENKQLGEPYRHERFRPLPLFIRDAGVGSGPYRQLLTQALAILRETPEDLLDEASFQLDQLEEWACDPRIYDHAHPANRRPNYVFGEWDGLQLDLSGNYRRYVSRQITLQVLLQRLDTVQDDRHAEYLHESAVVLAGTVLMASAMSGRGPGSFDSSVKLATLVPRIAQLRDRYYRQRFELLQGAHRQRLQEEAQKLRQPFAAARQHLNQAITKHRADQLQRRHVALVLADLGMPHAARDKLSHHAPVSAHFSVTLSGLLESCRRDAEAGRLENAALGLANMETALHRGIDCGALPDPWNALAFQAQYPIFQSMEDAVQDHRLHELCDLMHQNFHAAGRLLCEAAASGRHDIAQSVKRQTKRLAAWWDQFATVEISDLPKVAGEEMLKSALEVGEALADWHQHGSTAADLAFWRKHLPRFRSASSFALVIDVLLHRQDYAAAMALLMNWLSHASEVPLEDGKHSYFDLMLRWSLQVAQADALPPVARWKLLKRFLDLLEANAEEYWDLATLALEAAASPTPQKEDDPFAAAYEGMEYRDSTNDGTEGSLAEEESPAKAQNEFALEHRVEEITRRMRFLAHVAHVWRLVTRQVRVFTSTSELPVSEVAESLDGWWKVAQEQRARLTPLLAQIHGCVVPEPLGSHASMVEYDRQRMLKDRTLEVCLAAALDLAMAERSLLAARHVATGSDVPSGEADDWDRQSVQIENLVWRGETEKINPRVAAFLRSIRNVSLLYKPLDAGGQLHDLLETRLAQAILRDIAVCLPRLGLVRDTYAVLKAVRDQERSQSVQGRVVTEFNRLFEIAMQSLARSLARSTSGWQPAPTPSRVVHLLDQLAKPFLMLWIDHSHSVRLSSLEAIHGDEDWQQLRNFIQKFGSDLFHPRFMTLANLRAILNRGVQTYVNYLAEEAETAREDEQITGATLLAALANRRYPRDQAVRHLELVLKAVVENYEEYKDYNATTTQSDYGENLYRLLAFLRLKSTYERHVWNIKPLVWIHEALAREGQEAAALLWQQTMARLTAEIARRHVEELRELQQEHGMQLRTVADLVEERFVARLEMDRLVALVAPADKELAEENKSSSPIPATTHGPIVQKLLAALDVQLKKTTGSGLDLPAWIRELEQEMQFIQSQQKLENALEPPFQILPESQFESQLATWDLANGEFGLLPG